MYNKVVEKGMFVEFFLNGYWFKNFVVFFVYCCEDWVVIVKGFNKFVWDFEMGFLENFNGIF